MFFLPLRIVATAAVTVTSTTSAFVPLSPAARPSAKSFIPHSRTYCSKVKSLHQFSSARFGQSALTIRRMSDTPANDGENVGLSDIAQSTDANSKDPSNEETLPTWKERIDISIAKSRKIRGSNYVQISTVDYKTMEPRCRTVVFRGFLGGVPLDAVREVLLESGGCDDGHSPEDGSAFGCVMKMITDLRSNKVQELQSFHDGQHKGSSAEMVWWFPKSSEQYRIRGRLQFIGSNGPIYSYHDQTDESNNKTDESNNNKYFIAERKQQWGNLSDPAREQFYWQNPGITYSDESSEKAVSNIPKEGRDADGKVLPPPDTFLLMLLYPTSTDYLRLGDNFRQVDQLLWDDGTKGGSRGCSWDSKRVNP